MPGEKLGGDQRLYSPDVPEIGTRVDLDHLIGADGEDPTADDGSTTQLESKIPGIPYVPRPREPDESR